MYELSFHCLLSFLIDLSNSWSSKWIWKLLYAPMEDLTRFSTPTFWLFQIESLFIRISHVIIYFSSLLLHMVCYFTLIEYRLVLCSNFSLLCCEFCMFDEQFCECNCSISWVQFPYLSTHILHWTYTFLKILVLPIDYLSTSSWRVVLQDANILLH